ncbi:hypothetical protein J9260_08510 [Thiothrix unzii]|uniref:Uncharacterized protein n=1 Tax=Thiothrix unzii TaxID=111769 RepID=A0A975FBU9_9GAMM|nr:hypothetical protein J9260_08510 [Thiothrix unzii]
MSLGKRLIEEFELDIVGRENILSRWMAHYIAEKIIDAETAVDSEKQEAENSCVEAILDLWWERNSLPDGRRPFEKFEPIWETLEGLNPNSDKPYFVNTTTYESPEEGNEMQMWLTMASYLDRAARTLIEYSLRKAVVVAVDKKSLEWVQAAYGLDAHTDASAIVRLFLPEGIMQEDNKKTDAELEIEQLTIYKGYLQDFISTAESTSMFIDEKIENMKSKNLT